MALLKYPRTPYWPGSPAIADNGRYHESPNSFVGVEVVITEKLDGSNTLLHQGEVYGRSTDAPSIDKWNAMTKKYHAWKLGQKGNSVFRTSDLFLYGEDIYGVHSIEYNAVPETETFYAFALRQIIGELGLWDIFVSYDEMVEFCTALDIPTVPLLYRGTFDSVEAITEKIMELHQEPSSLGGEREGIVMRCEGMFYCNEFSMNVTKSVRQNHVQTNEHWTRNWRPCQIRS